MTRRKHISDSQRFSIIEPDEDFKQYCHLCGTPTSELHECFGGPNRQKSKDYGLVVTLCRRCHELAHSSHEIRHRLQQEAKGAFLQKVGNIETFRKVFGRYYV